MEYTEAINYIVNIPVMFINDKNKYLIALEFIEARYNRNSLTEDPVISDLLKLMKSSKNIGYKNEITWVPEDYSMDY